VLTVTPISESTVALQLADFLRIENQMGQIGGFQQARAVELFLEYLKSQYTHLSAAYPEFGDERSGSAFIIKQIESAIRYFRNPSDRQIQPNILDG
jgi:hypothetical protein